jgi:hypothetical protein
MHREIQGQIEQILASGVSVGEPVSGEVFLSKLSSGDVPRSVSEHLKECAECRQEIAAMQRHADWMRELRAPATAEPRPGFYARVMERIEAEGAVSVWNLFMESAFGRRIAVASVALALVLGLLLVSSERSEEPMVADQGFSESVQDTAAQNAFAEQSPIHDALPASATEFGSGLTATGLTDDDISSRILWQQQILMQQMIMDMDDAAFEDQVLVNLATYREQ